MLIRFLVKNLFSFKELTEFNMLSGRFNRLPHHVYKNENVDLLKLNVMYGANGAGKSNMIKAVSLLKAFVLEGKMPIEFITQTFKFDKESKTKDVYLGIEFIKDEMPYYYGLTINQGIVIEEELYLSGLGKQDDKNLFIRTDEINQKNLKVEFSDDLNVDSEAALFPGFLQNEILERNILVFFYMKNRQSKAFEIFKKAIEWIETDLQFVMPLSKASGLATTFEADKLLYDFTKQMIASLNTGISGVHIINMPLEHFFGEENKQNAEYLTSQLRANPSRDLIHHNGFEEIIFRLEDDKPFAKKIFLSHKEDGGKLLFNLSEESDGTRRLFELLPALFTAINHSKTYIIDEIERSIHPLLIKELVRKFSYDENTKGQLVFSTHESNLLDQDIFRPDEIWFAEKNKEGATEFSALSDFKEHHTIDIRKGYLNGRYGGIPFLGNLKDLNWDKYAEA